MTFITVKNIIVLSMAFYFHLNCVCVHVHTCVHLLGIVHGSAHLLFSALKII